MISSTSHCLKFKKDVKRRKKISRLIKDIGLVLEKLVLNGKTDNCRTLELAIQIIKGNNSENVEKTEACSFLRGYKKCLQETSHFLKNYDEISCKLFRNTLQLNQDSSKSVLNDLANVAYDKLLFTTNAQKFLIKLQPIQEKLSHDPPNDKINCKPIHRDVREILRNSILTKQNLRRRFILKDVWRPW